MNDYRILSVCHTFFHYVLIIVSSWNFEELLPMTNMRSMQKVRGQRSRSQRSKCILTVPDRNSSLNFTNDDEMMHKAWWCLGEVLFSRSSFKFQCHMVKKIFHLTQIRRFQMVNSMATKWCTKAWSGIENVPFCSSRLSVKLQGDT